MNFTFSGTGGGDKESIMSMIRQQMPEIANDIADTIATALQSIFHNMKAGAI